MRNVRILFALAILALSGLHRTQAQTPTVTKVAELAQDEVFSNCGSSLNGMNWVAFIPIGDGYDIALNGCNGIVFWNWQTDQIAHMQQVDCQGTRCFMHGFDRSPDGQRLVTGGSHATLWFLDGETPPVMMRQPSNQRGIWAAFSPDGRVHVWDNQGYYATYDGLSGELLEVVHDDDSVYYGSISFYPDGSRVVESRTKAGTYVLSTSTGDTVGKIHNQNLSSQAQFSPDGSRFVLYSTTVRSYDAKTLAPLTNATLQRAQFQHANFDHDLFTAAHIGDRTAAVRRMSNGDTLHLLTSLDDQGNRRTIYGIDVSPDGKHIAIVADGVAEVYAINAMSAAPTESVVGDRSLLLDAVRPNPTTGLVEIPFELSHRSPVRLTIVNALGQEVASFVNESLEPGRYIQGCDLSDLPAGLYRCMMTVGSERSIRPLHVVR